MKEKTNREKKKLVWTDEDYGKLYQFVMGRDAIVKTTRQTKLGMNACLRTLQPEERKALYLRIHKKLGKYAMAIRMFKTPRRVEIYLSRAARKLRVPPNGKILFRCAKKWGMETDQEEEV